MHLRELQCFVAVAEELHFGRAARRLNMTQPPVSLAIQRLERDLGTEVFVRSRRRVELTEPGKVLLEDARAILHKVAEARHRVQRVARGEAGSLTVGFVSMALNTAFPRAVRDFREAYPEVELELTQMRTVMQLEAVRSGALSVGVARPFERELGGLDAALFVREQYVAVLHEHHRLAAEPRISGSMLMNEPLIMFDRGDQRVLYDRFLAALEQQGLQPMVAQQVPTTTATVALAAAGIGVGFVPESARSVARSDVVFKEVDLELPPVEMLLLWRAGDRRQALRNFVTTMTNPCPRELQDY